MDIETTLSNNELLSVAIQSEIKIVVDLTNRASNLDISKTSSEIISMVAISIDVLEPSPKDKVKHVFRKDFKDTNNLLNTVYDRLLVKKLITSSKPPSHDIHDTDIRGISLVSNYYDLGTHEFLTKLITS